MLLKLELTQRLRGEGRWEEAQAYKEAQRQRLLSEGVKRSEANERAWELTEAAYPAYDEAALRFFTALIRHPSKVLAELQPGFVPAWRVVCRLLAYAAYVAPADFEPVATAAQRRTSLEPEPLNDDWRFGTERTNELVAVLRTDRLAAFASIENKLRDAVCWLEAQEAIHSATKTELEAILESLPKLKDVVQKDWPSLTENRQTASGQPSNAQPRAHAREARQPCD